LRLRASALARVHVLGPVSPEEVPHLMSACQLLVHPSRASEGRPLAVLEAAAAGLAVVSTPQGVEGDLIAGPEEGTLVAPGEPEALALALRRVLDDEPARTAAAATLRRKVLDRFGWDRVLDTACDELEAARAARR
jgi:glycosyltransferase involved in cell wall biosynthesis